MWSEPEDWQRPVGCPLCGAAVLDTEKHVEWHESAPGRPMTANRRSAQRDLVDYAKPEEETC
jgi:endogenous inhibitor of DNA gyrase (YacG/DUF329 family)